MMEKKWWAGNVLPVTEADIPLGSDRMTVPGTKGAQSAEESLSQVSVYYSRDPVHQSIHQSLFREKYFMRLMK